MYWCYSVVYYIFLRDACTHYVSRKIITGERATASDSMKVVESSLYIGVKKKTNKATLEYESSYTFYDADFLS